MLRRHFLLAQFSSFDWLHLQMDQKRREQARAEQAERDAQATRVQNIRDKGLALDKALHADFSRVTDPHITDAPATKRLRKAARDFAKSLE